ncbi:hypothetical protein GCM10012320_33260 [Sinomonas cellulolyticus]|nr:hypothetical protein GCM10012320_33260 [Sinomonas sp. KCTC 49339]
MVHRRMDAMRALVERAPVVSVFMRQIFPLRAGNGACPPQAAARRVVHMAEPEAHDGGRSPLAWENGGTRGRVKGRPTIR